MHTWRTAAASFRLIPNLCAALPVLWLILALSPAMAADPPRLKRADSFLGIHFDFHAGEDCTEVGKHTTPAMVEHHRSRPSRLLADRLQGTSRRVELSDEGGSSRAWFRRRSAAGLARRHRSAWSCAVHALLGSMGFPCGQEHPDWAVVNADGKPMTASRRFRSVCR